MKMKKIISMILAICMLTALLPTIVFAGEGEIIPIVVDFTKTTLTTNTTGNKSYEGLVTPGYTVNLDKSTTRGVRVGFVGNGLNTIHDQGYDPLSAKKTWPAEKDKGTVNNLMLTINVEAETAGYYSPELIYGTHNACGDFAIYINGQYAGEITDAWDANVSVKTNMPPIVLNTVYLKEGQNEISFKCILHRGTRVQSYLILNKLTFTYRGESLSATEYSHNLPKTMYIGQSADFTVSAKMSDGSTKIFGKYNEDGTEVTNPFIALSEIDGTGEITNIVQKNNATTGTFAAMSEGNAKINAIVNIDGNLFERTIDVRIRAEQPLEYVTLDFDKDSIPATRTALATIGIFDDEDGVFTAEYETLFESLDPEIATVAAGKNINEAVITGVSKGTARIKVTATAKGKTTGVTKEKLITVTDAPVIKELTLTTNKDTYTIGDEGTFTLSGTMSDGIVATEEDFAKINISYENDNESVISLNDVEKKFTAIAQGDAEISAIAEVAGDRIFVRRIVKVVADGAPIVANFAKTIVGDGNVLVGATTDGFKIIEEKSSTRGARVALEGSGLQVNHWISPASAGRTWPSYKDRNLMFTISVESEKAGYYSPEFIYEAYNKSGNFAIYINGQYAGEVNAYAAKQTKGVQRTATLNTVYLNYGTNEISFRLIKAYLREDSGKYDGVWLILDKLTLAPCGDTLSPVKYSHNLPSVICKGQSLDFAVSVKMSDG